MLKNAFLKFLNLPHIKVLQVGNAIGFQGVAQYKHRPYRFPVNPQWWAPLLFDFAVQNSPMKLGDKWIYKLPNGKYQAMSETLEVVVYEDFKELLEVFGY